jgi:hypothetical protein
MFDEAWDLIVVLGCLALGIVGLIVGGGRNGSGANDRWVEQERRLENEEDTRDQGPI